MNLLKVLMLTHSVFNRFIFIFLIVVSIETNRRNLFALFFINTLNLYHYHEY